jgi:predicted RNA methylase
VLFLRLSIHPQTVNLLSQVRWACVSTCRRMTLLKIIQSQDLHAGTHCFCTLFPRIQPACRLRGDILLDMPTQLSRAGFLELRALLKQSGYSEPNLRKTLGNAELPSRQLRNHARLLDRTSAQTEMNALIRWFWIGLSQERTQVASSISMQLLSLLTDSGLVVAQGEYLKPTAMLLPVDDFFVAADHPSAMERQDSDLVLWPNPTSKFLSRFAVRRHSRATLDLGTGSGILALVASRFSDTVVATDLNKRAIGFAEFNAGLNDIENIETASGDCFSPVTGRKFDLILSNPPFFITPQADYLFCDNTMELDGLCRRLIKEAPVHLNEDGYMQMLCEWAQIKGQPWEERVAEWLQKTGCDGWVMKGLTQDPEEYAQHRIRETSADTSRDAQNYSAYMSYYRQREVEAIHDGLIVLRRREGPNFVRIEEVPPTPTGNLSDLILSTFAAHDLVRNHSTDEKLLLIHPTLAPHARLEQRCIPASGHWKTESLVLRLTSGFPFHMDVQPLVADFLVSCDGSRTAQEVIEELAKKANVELDRVTRECLNMIRNLIERGFMIAAESPALTAETTEAALTR